MTFLNTREGRVRQQGGRTSRVNWIIAYSYTLSKNLGAYYIGKLGMRLWRVTSRSPLVIARAHFVSTTASDTVNLADPRARECCLLQKHCATEKCNIIEKVTDLDQNFLPHETHAFTPTRNSSDTSCFTRVIIPIFDSSLHIYEAFPPPDCEQPHPDP